MKTEMTLYPELWVSTARNLPQLNANKVPLTLHYGFEGRIIILHKNSYRWRLQNEAETVGKEHCNLLSQDDAHAHRKSVQIAGGGRTHSYF